jgi:hypothetical protein
MIINSWSVSVRHMWGLPYNAHKYLIETLSGTHASTMLMCRFTKFIQGIKKSPKQAVQFLYDKIKKNVNTVTGRNVAFVLKATGSNEIENIKTQEVMKRVKFYDVPEENTFYSFLMVLLWRL